MLEGRGRDADALGCRGLCERPLDGGVRGRVAWVRGVAGVIDRLGSLEEELV